MRVVSWLRAMLRRTALEREMHEEMAEHLERAAERLMSRGLSAEEIPHAQALGLPTDRPFTHAEVLEAAIASGSQTQLLDAVATGTDRARARRAWQQRRRDG